MVLISIQAELLKNPCVTGMNILETRHVRVCQIMLILRYINPDVLGLHVSRAPLMEISFAGFLDSESTKYAEAENSYVPCF